MNEINLLKNRRKTTTLLWISSHIRISGNKVVDKEWYSITGGKHIIKTIKDGYKTRQKQSLSLKPAEKLFIKNCMHDKYVYGITQIKWQSSALTFLTYGKQAMISLTEWSLMKRHEYRTQLPN